MALEDFSPEAVIGVLERGDLVALIGEAETDWFDCKREPYWLDRDTQKHELAKDVSSFANASGGLILLGLKTKKSPSHPHEEVKEICSFPEDLVPTQRYYDVLRDWIYPSLHGIDVRWYASAADPTKGIVAVRIPPQPRTHGPFPVTRTIEKGDKRVETVFGFFERRRDKSEPTTVQRLQSLLRDGLHFNELGQRIDSLQEMLQPLVEESFRKAWAAGRQQREQELDDQIGQALRAAGLADRPALVLAAKPTEPVDMPTLFHTFSELVAALQMPPELRRGGFNLGTLGRGAPIIAGQLRRKLEPGDSVLDLWRDGTLVFAATGGREFLCWGQYASENEVPRINPVALIESTYLFAELSKRVFEHARPVPNKVVCRLELKNLLDRGRPFGLKVRVLDPWYVPGPGAKAPRADFKFEVEQRGVEPGALTFQLVREVYAWFGVGSEKIPLTDIVHGQPVISPEQIRKLH